MAHRLLVKAAIALLFVGSAWASTAARAGVVTYAVSMDTTSVQGQTGYLTMDFLPSLSPLPATALVDGFYFDGTFIADTQSFGDVSGDLSVGGVTLGNSTAFNSQNQAMVFGSFLGFNLTLSSDAIGNLDPNATGGTTFAFYLFDRIPNPAAPPDYTTGNSLILTGGPGDAVLTAELCDCGIVTVTPFAAVVPEPATIVSAALSGLILFGRRLRRSPSR